MAKVPSRVADRFVKEVGRYQKVLQSAKDRDVNESDTVMIVTDILADVFGFDKYSEITSEFAIRGTYCDLAVKLDGKVKYLIEVKAIGLGLKESHVRQAVNYAATHGITHVILTNGVTWEVYGIRFEQPIQHDQIFTLNFLEVNPRREEYQEKLYPLCKEGLNKAAIEEFQEHVQTVNRFTVAAMLLSDTLLNALRKEFKTISPNLRVDVEEISEILQNEVLKREVIECDKALQARHRLKKATAKAQKKPKDETPKEQGFETTAEVPADGEASQVDMGTKPE